MNKLYKNDLIYRMQLLGCYIGTFGDNVAREFLNGNSSSLKDFKKLRLLVKYFRILECYKTEYNLFLLENDIPSNILLEDNSCLLLEQ